MLLTGPDLCLLVSIFEFSYQIECLNRSVNSPMQMKSGSDSLEIANQRKQEKTEDQTLKWRERVMGMSWNMFSHRSKCVGS